MSLRHVLSTIALEQATAIEGIRAAGLACDPPEPAPGWRESAL
jgi:hypothetical protein